VENSVEVRVFWWSVNWLVKCEFTNVQVFVSVTFEDYETAAEVMAARRPSHQKQLGRQVRNYNEDQWNAVCKDIVKKGNIAKVCVIEDESKTSLVN